MDEAQLKAWNAQAANESCRDMGDLPRKHLTDKRAWERIKRYSGCGNAAELQSLEREKRDAAPRKALKGGVSIRQASRLTGISIGVIRKIGRG